MVLNLCRKSVILGTTQEAKNKKHSFSLQSLPKITRLVLLVAAKGNRTPKTVHLQQLQGMQSSKLGM